jgi:hypothetical protein
VSARAAAKARVESFMMFFLNGQAQGQTQGQAPEKITEAYLCSALPDTSGYEVRVCSLIY